MRGATFAGLSRLQRMYPEGALHSLIVRDPSEWSNTEHPKSAPFRGNTLDSLSESSWRIYPPRSTGCVWGAYIRPHTETYSESVSANVSALGCAGYPNRLSTLSLWSISTIGWPALSLCPWVRLRVTYTQHTPEAETMNQEHYTCSDHMSEV